MNEQTIHVSSRQGDYPVVVAPGGHGAFYRRIGDMLGGAKTFVISDTRVGPFYGVPVAAALDAPLLQLPEGEHTKTLNTLGRVCEWLVENGIERGHGVVAVGGGVISDIAGFAAAVVLRGVPWIAVPTTLLAMVDAAIGAKTGVDLAGGKNLVGCFWAPRTVLVDPEVLITLERRQLRSGLAEVLKAAVISPFHMEPVFDRHMGDLLSGSLRGATDLIVQAVRVKAEIVSGDEREEGARAALNLGHTLGHALEAATGYRLFLHGEAVAWGMLAALRLARDRGLLSTDEAMRWAGRLQKVSPLPPVSPVPWSAVAPFLARDKKRADGVTRWVLPRPGGVSLGVAVPHAEVADVYADLQRLPSSGQFTTLF